jgi:tetratricopeptide (TPR) repeat protein
MLACCLVALAGMLWRGGELAAELSREREAFHAYQRGSELLAGGQRAAAVEAFREALALAPKAVEAYGALAEAEYRQRHFDQAIDAYRRWLAVYPYTYMGVLYRDLGLIELRAGRSLDARRDFEEAVRLDHADWLAYYWLGHAYRRLGLVQDARAAWQQVVRLNPQFAPVYEQLRRLGNPIRSP